MKYVVFGAGGFAKEVISYILDDGHEIVAVVSDDSFNNDEYNQAFPVLKSIQPGEFPDAQFILAVGEIKYKVQIVEKNEDRWGTFIHSSCHVSKFSKIGKGCVICPHSTVAGDCVLGDFVTLNLSCSVTHDNIIGDYCTFSPYAGTMGYCRIGSRCFFGTSAIAVPKVVFPTGTKLSAGAVARKSIEVADTLYGDPAAPRGKK